MPDSSHFSSISPRHFPDEGRRAAVVQELRRLLPGNTAAGRVMPFGLAALDRCLPDGGLAAGALHEVVAATAGAWPAAFGFVVAILACAFSPPLLRERSPARSAGGRGVMTDSVENTPLPNPPPQGGRKRSELARTYSPSPAYQVVFVLPRYGRRRQGGLSGHGLASLGLDPLRIVLVETAHRKDTLWTLAEALRSTVPLAVAGIIDGLDLKTSQKLHLAAVDAGLPLLLLRPALAPGASGEKWRGGSAAATRWRIGPAIAARDRFGMHARPRWHVQLERCRNGRPGEWVVEYDHVAHRFSMAAALADPAVSRGTGDPSQGFRFRHAGRS